MTHCSSEQVQAYVDGRLPRDEESSVGTHLRDCPECSRAYKAIRQINGFLKRLPLENASTDLARSIMEKLSLSTGSSLAFRLVENVAYFFGLLLVLGVMAAVFIFTGVLDTEQISQTQGVISKVWLNIGAGGLFVVGDLTDSLQRFFPFIFRTGNVSITFFGGLVVLVLAVVDWFVRRRSVRRV